MLNIRKSIFLLIFISLFELLNAQIKTIYVSIEPQLYILQQIGKYKINVKVILDKKRVRFKYPLKGKMLRDISKSAIYMTVGADFEKDWIKQITDYNKQYNIKFNIKDSSEGIPKLYKNSQENIYFWLDPIYLRDQSLNMYEELVKLNPENQEFYRKNYDILIDKINELYLKIVYLLDGQNTHKFFVVDPMFSFYSDRFGLQQFGINIISNMVDARELIRLIELVKYEKITKIVLNKNNKSVIQNMRYVKKYITCKIIKFDPFERVVIGNILSITKDLVD